MVDGNGHERARAPKHDATDAPLDANSRGKQLTLERLAGGVGCEASLDAADSCGGCQLGCRGSEDAHRATW